MTFSSNINCPKYTSLKPAASLFVQGGTSVKGLFMVGFNECDCIGRSSEISNNLYWANLPTG